MRVRSFPDVTREGQLWLLRSVDCGGFERVRAAHEIDGFVHDGIISGQLG